MFCLAYLGCEPNFTPNTTWYEPCLRDWSELPSIKFDPNNRWWQLTKEMMRLSAERAEGRWLVTETGILALIDIICGLLGNEKTLMAMVDQPEAIKVVRDRMMPWARQTYDEFDNIGRCRQEGSIDWMQIWAPGRVISTQCDMSVMISPEMFRDFVVPELTDIYNHVDYGIYHMDGPEQIRHLDELLKIKKLHLIQWQPGARMNNPSHGDPMNWIDLFKRIQEAGKKVIIACPRERVRPLLNKIAHDRVFLSIPCRDEQTARNVLLELDSIGV
jgi:5-methyltetrahydrofolate--homocysteine methyltransferase